MTSKKILQPGEPLDNGRYKVVRRLPAGGSYSQIYIVENNKIPVKNILKINLPHEEISKRNVSSAVYLGSQIYDHNQRTENEVNILSNLSHPNIIKPIHLLKIKKRYQGILFESLSNPQTLKYFSRKNHGYYDFLTGINLYGIFTQLYEVFYYLGSKRCLHRDVKPNNILIDSGKYVKLIDFGLATKVGPTDKEGYRKKSDGVWGSSIFAPPEVHLGKQHFKSDFWSLGITMDSCCGGGFILDSEVEPNVMIGKTKISREKKEQIKTFLKEAATSEKTAEKLELLIDKILHKKVEWVSNLFSGDTYMAVYDIMILRIEEALLASSKLKQYILGIEDLLKVDPAKRYVDGWTKGKNRQFSRRVIDQLYGVIEEEPKQKSLIERLKFWKK